MSITKNCKNIWFVIELSLDFVAQVSPCYSCCSYKQKFVRLEQGMEQTIVCWENIYKLYTFRLAQNILKNT